MFKYFTGEVFECRSQAEIDEALAQPDTAYVSAAFKTIETKQIALMEEDGTLFKNDSAFCKSMAMAWVIGVATAQIASKNQEIADLKEELELYANEQTGC